MNMIYVTRDLHPIEQWNGGKVHLINDSVIHLMRGQIYTIDKLKFFTIGGCFFNR